MSSTSVDPPAGLSIEGPVEEPFRVRSSSEGGLSMGMPIAHLVLRVRGELRAARWLEAAQKCAHPAADADVADLSGRQEAAARAAFRGIQQAQWHDVLAAAEESWTLRVVRMPDPTDGTGGALHLVSLATPRTPAATRLPYVRARELCAFLSGTTVPEQLGEPRARDVRPRHTGRRQVAVTLPTGLGQVETVERITALLPTAAPGEVRVSVDAEGTTDVPWSSLDLPDPEGGSLLLDRSWAVGLPDDCAGTGLTVEVAEHSEDPRWAYPLTAELRTASDGSASVLLDHDVRAVGRVEVDRLADRLTTGEPLPAADTATLPARIARRFAQAPAALTAVRGEVRVDYRELDERSAALAGLLRRHGHGRGSVIGIALPRSVEALVAIVAVLRVGGAYLPLDVAYPRERLAFMAADSGVDTVLGDPVSLAAYPDLHTLDIGAAEGLPGDPEWAATGANDALYVLYTSGSTGTPKAVVHTVGAIGNLVDWHSRTATAESERRVLQFASLNFDVAAQEILTALADGKCLVLPEDEERTDPEALVALLARERVTEYFCPQVMLQEVCRTALETGTALPALRHIFQSGEPLVMNDGIARFLDANPAVTLHNHYGPTETHVITALALSRGGRGHPRGPVRLGPLLDTCDGYVLDERLRPVGVGGTGELYASARQLSRGYLHRPGLTAERYVPDPYGPPGARMYRTGDLVEVLPNGHLGYVARADFQAKVRGHRVEPDEVTARLLDRPEVANAATVVRRTAGGSNVLVSFVVPRTADRPEATSASGALAERLREGLTAVLPDYLVPSAVVPVDALPLTPSGKVDKAALPDATDAGRPDPTDHSTDPRGGARQGRRAELAAIWAAAIGVAEVAEDDDFFRIGGSSLAAIEVASKARQRLGVPLGVRDITERPRFADFAALVEERSGNEDQTTTAGPVLLPRPQERYAPFDLLDQQQAYLIGRGGDLDGGGVACHLYLEYEGREATGAEATGTESTAGVRIADVQTALRQVIAQHDMLRTVFDEHAMTQRVLPDDEVPPYVCEVLDAVAEPGIADEVRERLSHESRAPGVFPLFNVVFVRLPGGRLRMCVSIDALLADARGVQVFFDDWGAALRGEPAPTGPRPTFRDYVACVARLREGQEFARAAEYWRERLDELPEGPLLPRRGEGAGPTAAPVFVNRRHTVTSDRWARICEDAAERGLTPTAVVLAAYAWALAQWADEPRFLLNVPSMSRHPVHSDIDQVIGEFASFTLLEVDASAVRSFEELAARLQRRLLTDLDHRHFNGMDVTRELIRRRGGIQGALAPVVMTSELGVGDGVDRVFDGRMTESFALSQTPQVWMDLLLRERDGALVLNWDVVEELFPPAVVDGVFRVLVGQLERLGREPSAWSGQPLPALPPALAQERGRGPDRAPAGVWPHAAVRDQALRTPEAPALVDGGTTLSRAQLAGAAQAVADTVAEARGGPADPQQPVAVLLERGWRLYAACLGVLEAGHPYLPIDATLPPARIATVLRRANVRLVLTEPATHGLVTQDADGPRLLDIGGVRAQAPERLRPTGPDPRDGADLAYVLFTSGSTGEPKGVPITLAGLANCVEYTIERFKLSARDTSLAVASVHHDLSLFDLFAVLGAGGTTVLAGRGADADGGDWARAVRQHHVTALCAAPAVVEMLLDGASTLPRSEPEPEPETQTAGVSRSVLESLRLVLTGGDWVPLPLLDRLREAAPTVLPVSIGGPTETTGWNILHPVPAADTRDPEWATVPYGRPLPHTYYRVVDADTRDRPEWASGELLVAGVGVTPGYLADGPVLGRERHHTDPDTGEVFFRTGDLGRWRDGLIEFVGRADDQVQIRGHRVEPGEVSAFLNRLPGVRRSAILTLPGPGEKHAIRGLAAFVVLEEADPDGTRAEAVRAAAHSGLPGPSRPQQVIAVETLPTSRNGKVDRRALARIYQEELAATESDRGETVQEPDSALEWLICEVWSRHLTGVPVTPDDNFFALGGDSLLVTRVVVELREVLVGARVRPGGMFATRSVREFAAHLRKQEADPDGLEETASLYREVAGMSDEDLDAYLAESPDDTDQFDQPDPSEQDRGARLEGKIRAHD